MRECMIGHNGGVGWFRYGYWWCSGALEACNVGAVTNLSESTRSIEKNQLPACTAFTVTVFAYTATAGDGQKSNKNIYTSVKCMTNHFQPTPFILPYIIPFRSLFYSWWSSFSFLLFANPYFSWFRICSGEMIWIILCCGSPTCFALIFPVFTFL